jgi:hypothetical protein
MMPTLATIEDLSKLIEVTDTDRAEAALEDASVAVRARAGITWVDDSGDLIEVPDAIVSVTRQAAKRQYANPGGYASEQIGQYSYRLSAGGTGGGLELTPAEEAIVDSVVGRLSVGTVGMCRNVAGEYGVYLPVSDGGADILYSDEEWEDAI